MTKKKLLIVLIMMIIIVSIYIYLKSIAPKRYESISMGLFLIEEKHDYTKPGKYTEMWIIGSNAAEEGENKEKYKIYIEEAMVYNLIEKGETYMISASSFREDEGYGYVYALNQISNQEEYQLVGKGRIK